MSAPKQVIVVGAGIAGLVAARDLQAAGAQVLVLESSDRVGGQIHTVDAWGGPVELGAEAVHLASPAIRGLLDELGLADSTVASGPGRTWLATGKGLRRLPAGVGPNGPTRLGPVIRSGILGPLGLARAALEPWIARHTVTSADVSVGRFVRRRFGRQVAERLVDPMLGNLHSGDIDRLSLQSATPSLAAVAASGRSLTTSRTARRSGPSVAPAAFVTWPRGLRTLSDRLAEGLPVRTGVSVNEIRRDGDRYAVGARPTGDASGLGVEYVVDAVVLATPADVSARLLRDVDATAADRLAAVPFASVVSVVLRYDAAATARHHHLSGTGIMVPAARERLLKAATFVTSKWPHLANKRWSIIRLSAGRSNDDAAGRPATGRSDQELIDGLRRDLADLTGLTAAPDDVIVHRWERTVPQLEVGHRDRITAARASLAQRAPGLELAGTSIDGVGIASAMTSGRAAAARLLDGANHHESTTAARS